MTTGQTFHFPRGANVRPEKALKKTNEINGRTSGKTSARRAMSGPNVRSDSPPVLVLTLPPPPTTNNLFLNAGRKGRIKSPRYRSWENTAGWELKRQRPGTIAGDWQADIALPSGLTGDLDNYLKPIFDLLVKHRVVDDDKHCVRLSVEKGGPGEGVTVTLRGQTQ